MLKVGVLNFNFRGIRYNSRPLETVIPDVMRKHGNNKSRKCGQIMLEYVVALGVFVAMVGICAILIHVFRAYGNRVLDIIAVS